MRIERQQPLAERLVERGGSGAVMKDIDLRIITLRRVRCTVDLDLAYQRGDGCNRTWYRKLPGNRHDRVLQVRVNPLTDRPNLFLARQRIQGPLREVGNDFIEASD